MESNDVCELALSLIRVTGTATEMDDFCRRIALDLPMSSFPTAALIYMVGEAGMLHLGGKYGSLQGREAPMKITGQKSCVLAKSIRNHTPAIALNDEVCTDDCHSPLAANSEITAAVFVPVRRQASLFGVMVLMFAEAPERQALEREAFLIQLSLESLITGHWTQIEDGLKPATNLQDALLWMTSRQLEILNLLAENLTSGQIAREMHVSESTVKQELGRIYRRLGVSDRSQAKAVYLSLLSNDFASQARPEVANAS